MLKLYDSCIPNELRKRKLLTIMALGKAGLVSLPLLIKFIIQSIVISYKNPLIKYTALRLICALKFQSMLDLTVQPFLFVLPLGLTLVCLGSII
jgi:hypothetical protein